VSIREFREWPEEKRAGWKMFMRNGGENDIPHELRTEFQLHDLCPGSYYGFTLTGDGRYCLEGGLVTHNTGKTYVACETIRRTDVPTLVVCPKVSIPMWHDVGAQVGVEFDVIGWEKVRTGRTPYGRFENIGRGSRFMWAPEVKLLVFDEAHQACGMTSLNSKMVTGARMLRKKTLCITATPAESPLQMKALGYVLGLHNGTDFWSFALRNGCSPGNFGGLHFTENKEKAAAVMARLSAQLEPRVVRVRIADLGDQFPDVVYTSPLIELDESEEVERLHQEAADAYRKIKECGLRGGSEEHPMTKMLRARQKIEILKLPGWVELGKNALSAGHTVFFFVNFKDTIQALHAKFPDFGIVDGQSKNRNEVINAIQADRMRGCILNNEAGGVSISIHDITGKHPRYSIISPPVKAKSFRQVNFRTRRNGSLTTPHISVPVVAKTCEVKIKQRIDRRLDNNDILCDGMCDGDLLYET